MKDQFKPGDRVEVRDHDSLEWNPGIFVAYVDLNYPYLVTSECGQYAISYAQCRHKVVVDPEVARQARIQELEQELAQLKNQ